MQQKLRRRGHWTKGKPRHQPARQLIDQITELLRKHGTTSRPAKGQLRVSIRAIAEDVGVSDRTVRRWLGHAAGGDAHNPAPDHKRRLRSWLKRTRRKLG